jgi:hypothetical protein
MQKKKKNQKNPNKIITKTQKRFILVHNFGNFSTWSIGPVDFGPMVRPESKEEEATHLLAIGKQRERRIGFQ